MKTMTAVFLFSCFLAVTAFGQARNNSQNADSQKNRRFPGGVIFSDGKDAILWDAGALPDAEDVNLTKDLPKAMVKDIFAASQCGGWLVWLRNGSFWLRQLPNGKPYAIQSWNQEACRPMLSMNGDKLSFEGVCTTKPVQTEDLSANKTYVGIFLLDAQLLGGDGFGRKIEPTFGWQSPVIHLDKTYRGKFWISNNKKAPFSWAGTKTIPKSAHFLTFSKHDWEKGKKLAYFMLKIGGKWGPIEIRQLDTGFPLPEVPGVPIYHEPPPAVAWEIPVSMSQCQGLAVRPDGALAVWSGPKIYLIEKSDIDAGMQKYKPKLAPHIQPTSKKGLTIVLDGEGAFKVNASLVNSSQGVEGTCMNWVSNDAFLFLDDQGSLCLWKKGEVQVLRRKVGKWYSYWDQSPFETSISLGKGSGRAQYNMFMALKMGHIRSDLHGLSAENRFAEISVSGGPGQKELEFCLTTHRKFEQVGDLSQYKWCILEKRRNEKYLPVPLRMITLLREAGGTKVVLFRPNKIEPKSLEKPAGAIRVMPVPGWLVYDWEGRTLKNVPSEKATALSLKDLPPMPVVTEEDQERVETYPMPPILTPRVCPEISYPEYGMFSVGGVKGFHWVVSDLVTAKDGRKSALVFPKNEELGARQSLVVAGQAIEDIKDPAQYADEITQFDPYQRCTVGNVVIVRFKKLPGRFFAVQLSGYVVAGTEKTVKFKTRVWPENEPSKVARAGDQPR